ncbi:type 1 glutamine amidotransferase domain-containing protein [Veronia nyctiphanis]|uniref:Type 1 glutamine amidotransferase domain-containing protein n=1 Tax=Veronia nyctiphanis TaxID=1278244 RepID=A0A4Q0YS79_9GAMM|nr:type 1 glutamine amidotransferase domain-containing protein [Veronia nyctiphanis]RXJ74042.1 type 1 glutamine amidotransferase domain-containing protein [Veronia nyctiphanis]
MVKKIFLGLLIITGLVVASGFWVYSLVDRDAYKHDFTNTQKSDLPYLTENIPEHRGKILAVVTSHSELGDTGKRVGYELTELSRAYYVFEANGFSVDIASPQGGLPPQVKDGDDMNQYDYAFLNDEVATKKLEDTIKLSDINPHDYQAVYFVGGKGTMFDFIGNPEITELVEHFYNSNKTIVAVCHGPAALLGAKNEQGEHIIANKRITAFTNQEELLLIPDAKEVFGQLLQTSLVEKGAKFSAGAMYLNNVEVDGNVITGQNPWSVWTMAEATIEQLGYTPKQRTVTAEENTLAILSTYHQNGSEQALRFAKSLQQQELPYEQNTILLYAALDFWQLDVIDGVGRLALVQQLKNLN